MSGAIGGIGPGSLAQLMFDLTQTHSTIDTLQSETATGYLSTTYAGLGQGARLALDLPAAIATHTAAQSAANQALTTMQATQTALTQIQSIVTNVTASLAGTETDTNSMDTVAATARDGLTQIAHLLDTQVGGVYIFAGQDSANPPIPNPDAIGSSGFATAIATAIGNLTTNGAAATSSAILAIASPGGTSPFSASLEASAKPAIVDLEGQTVRTGVLANTNADAVSSGIGTTSTGSYMRDALMGLAAVGSLTSAQATSPAFLPFIQSTIATLQGAGTAMTTDMAALGDRQNVVTAAKTTFTDLSTALSTQLGQVQDADLAQVATQLSAAQTTLQASYQVIAVTSQMTLAKFLPAA